MATRTQANPDRDPINQIVDDQMREYYHQQFVEHFPGQMENITRLISERLRNDLRNRDQLTPARDIESLAVALESAYRIMALSSNLK